MATAAVEAVPSHMRGVPGSTNIHVARFPSDASTPEPSLDAAQVASDVCSSINAALAKGDLAGLSRLFVDDGYWRDHLALTWAFRTARTPAAIQTLLEGASKSKDGLRLRRVAVDASEPSKQPKVAALDAAGTCSGVKFFIALETAVGAGDGLVQLVEVDGRWRIFTLYTRLQEVRGHEEGIRARRPRGVEHGGQPGRKNWAERRAQAAAFEDGNEPAVLIIGAGQGGLTAAARLKMMGVEALVVDQEERVGDNWRNRYHQLVLHDPVWYDHLPYMPFPPHWPIFTPKDKLADFFEAYAGLLELNVWTRTALTGAAWDDAQQVWTVTVERRRADGSSETRTFHPRHLIQATGHSGKKNMPQIRGMDTFRGHRLCHSSEFPGARAQADDGTTRRRAIVVGSCNSAHDIAQDFVEKGYDITVVQRSTTHVVSSRAITDIALAGVYEEAGPPVDVADMLIHGLPTPVLKANQVKVVERQNELDRPTLDGLARAGFQVDRGPDGAGLFFKYFQRGGGYYIDVGACQLIADGRIKVKQGQEIDAVLPHGLRFADGTEVEADEIVFATGYQNMRTQTRAMLGDAVADRVSDVWGFNAEGEMRTIWQRSGHPGFWFHGGNLALCRYYSKLLALQIVAQEAGLYRDGEI